MGQFALAQQTEMPVDKYSLRSCVWIHFPDGFPLFFFFNFFSSNVAFSGDQLPCSKATLKAKDQTAVAQRTEMSVDEHSLRSRV